MAEIYLNDIAHGRSGDKGDTSNVCVYARKPEYYKIIEREVTPEKLKAYFGDMVKGEITRYDVPSLNGFNFVMKHALGGGATMSLRLDSLGKSMGSAVMRMKIHVKKIAVDVDINQKQAKDWLQILETLGIIFYLHPYSNNLLKRLVKTPKLYFYDTGLVSHLTRWSNAEVLEYGAMNGAILENYVVSEIAKTYLNCGQEPYMYYYRDKDAREIDIVLEHDGMLNPLEIKMPSHRILQV